MRSNCVLLVGTYVTAAHNHSVGEDLGERLRQRGWRVTMTSSATNRLVRLADMLSTAWRARNHYDVAQVDVYSGKAFIWAEVVCALLRRLHKPYVLTLHGGNLPRFAKRWPGRVRRLLNSAMVVTTPSRYLLHEMALYRTDLRLLPNPVDLTHYPFRLRRHAAPRLVWIRAFHRIYNPELAPEVVARLQTDFPDIHLTMVGPDKDGSLAKTQQRARELTVLEAIDFPGGVPHDEIPSWLSKADIFMNTTHIESFGVSVMEAAACGLCIATTAVGELPFIWKHGENAAVVPDGDADSMASEIGKILRSPGYCQKLSREARRNAERYSWEKIFGHWETLFWEVKNG